MNPNLKAQMDKDLADFRASKGPQSGGGLRVQMDKDLADFRAGKDNTNQPQFNVAPIETREQKITRFNNESAVLDKKSKEANSALGMTKNFGKAFVGTVASSPIGLGKSLQKIYGNQSDTYTDQINQTGGIQANLLKQIRKNDAEGKDSTKLKQLYNEGDRNIQGLQGGLNQETTLPSTGKVVGELGGTALDLLTFGTYGKAKTAGMTFNKLAQKPTTLLQKASMINPVTRTLSKFTKQNVSNIAIGGGVGYATDVTQGLQNDEENPYALGFGSLIGGGIPALSKGTASIKNTFGKQGKINKVVEKRGQAIDQLNKYKILSTANEKATGRGIDIKDTLSRTDVLSGAVDTTGTISTKFEGGAIEQYTKMHINKNEAIVSQALQKEGRFVNPDIVQKYLTEKVKNSGLQGRSLSKALANIDGEIEGYRIFANQNGQIPVEVIHKAKADKYSNINFMTDAEKQKYEKTIAQGLKEIVEKNTDSIDVRKVNEELSKHFAVVNYLEKLDGKKVDGGKLGKYFAQTLGAYVGGMVGGPLGAVAGAEVGGRTKGVMMSRAFKGKTGGTMPEGASITQAKEYLGKESLQLPQSNKVGNRYIPQSTTITNTINDIPKIIPPAKKLSNPNVDKSLPRKRGQDGMIRIGGVKATNIHPEDANVMKKIVETPKITDLNNNNYRNLESLSERFNISIDKPFPQIKKAFDDVLSGKTKVKGTLLPGSLKKPLPIAKTSSAKDAIAKGMTEEEFIKGQRGTEIVDSPFQKNKISSVYHQTNPQSARIIIFADTENRGLNVSTLPELALGQKGNGATIEFSTRRLSGIKIQKPGADFIESTQGKHPEYELTTAPPKLTPDVRTVTFDQPLSPKSERDFFGLRQDWKDTKKLLPNGKVKYLNPNHKTTTQLRAEYQSAMKGKTLPKKK